jgi:hypothetical protein
MKTNQEIEKLILSKIEYYNFYVALEGAVGDWACYVGNRNQTFADVAAYGDKISEEKARELFPEFKHLRWRP